MRLVKDKDLGKRDFPRALSSEEVKKGIQETGVKHPKDEGSNLSIIQYQSTTFWSSQNECI